MTAPSVPKYFSRGAGNGLPFCPRPVEVGSFDLWITLGGTKKGQALTGFSFERQKAVSQDFAKRLYWDLDKWNFSASVINDVTDTGTGTTKTFSVSLDSSARIAREVVQSFQDGSVATSGNVVDPFGRVCPPSQTEPGLTTSSSNHRESRILLVAEADDGELGNASVRIKVELEIVAMYSEGVFAGYGMGGSFQGDSSDTSLFDDEFLIPFRLYVTPSVSIDGSFGEASLTYNIGSYAMNSQQSPSEDKLQKFAYGVTGEGMPVVYFAEVNGIKGADDSFLDGLFGAGFNGTETDSFNDESIETTVNVNGFSASFYPPSSNPSLNWNDV